MSLMQSPNKKSLNTIPKKVAYYGVFASCALLLGYVERLIPLQFAVPGIKLGLGNIVVLVTLYFMGPKHALSVSLIKVFVTALLFTGPGSLLFSASGALAGFFAMLAAKKMNCFSIMGVSIVGGVFHNIGQILMAAFVVNNLSLLYYFPVLFVSGAVMGVFTGIISSKILNYLTFI